jgi:hypothetical protein
MIGVNVTITIFGDFHQFSSKKLAFFLKTNAWYDNFFLAKYVAMF